MEYDIAIIGCGPAGLSAAIFCGRANLKAVILGNQEKSQMHMAMHIENYFGFPEGIDGPILLNRGIVQAQKFGVSFIKEDVISIKQEEKQKKFTIETANDEISARAIIIATGVPIKLSGIKNEEGFTGKGVHYCVSCDGPMYNKKKIAIIGNGDHAADDAIEALSYTNDITIISNAASFEFSEKFDQKIGEFGIKTKIAKISEFRGEKFLDTIVLENGKEEKFDGVFMACGVSGALDFAINLGLETENNILVVDENGMTSMEGVFAAGNCAGKCRQISKNVGDGCNAAVSAIKYLRSKELYIDYVHNTEGISVTKKEVKIEHVKDVVVQKPKSIKEDKKKLRVGWFSFSCCEDSTIVFTEMLNDYWDKWKNLIDIRHCKVLKKNNDMSDLDVAFVEGAIATDKARDEVRAIRNNAKKIVAVGSCAITGLPSGQRNNFDERRKREIQPVVDFFKYNENVVAVHDVVRVDENVPGCPMNEASFLAVLDKYLKEFDIDA